MEEKVREDLLNGWVPQGGISSVISKIQTTSNFDHPLSSTLLNKILFAQAMVREDISKRKYKGNMVIYEKKKE